MSSSGRKRRVLLPIISILLLVSNFTSDGYGAEVAGLSQSKGAIISIDFLRESIPRKTNKPISPSLQRPLYGKINYFYPLKIGIQGKLC
jgi:hypothetical protein